MRDTPDKILCITALYTANMRRSANAWKLASVVDVEATMNNESVLGQRIMFVG